MGMRLWMAAGLLLLGLLSACTAEVSPVTSEQEAADCRADNGYIQEKDGNYSCVKEAKLSQWDRWITNITDHIFAVLIGVGLIIILVAFVVDRLRN